MWTWMASALAAAPAAAPVTSLCEAGITVFTCETTNQKVLSVCASPGVSRSAGWVQYRFGRLGAIELTAPPTVDDSGPSAWMVTFIGGPARDAGLAYALDVRVGDLRYQVYEGYAPLTKPTDHRPENRVSAGVRVGTRNNELLADIRCGPRIAGTLAGFPIDWVVEEDELRR